jgi:hypothetical protein
MAATASVSVAPIESRSLALSGVELVEAHISRSAADGPACGRAPRSGRECFFDGVELDGGDFDVRLLLDRLAQVAPVDAH